MRFVGGKLLYAKIDTASSGSNALVAAVTGSIIRVYAVVATLATGTIKFQSASTDLTGAMTLTAITLDPLRLADAEWQPHFVCAVSEAFNATLSGANQLSGYLLYTVEPSGT